ncbi:MAG: TlpA family protein disulfide reductase [Bacteroidota bacterium]
MNKKLLHLVFFLFATQLTVCQETEESDSKDKTYFSEQIALHHNHFTKKAKRAIKIGKNEKAVAYYNTLINEYLIGSYMDNFNVDCLNTNKCCIDDYENPMILMTYASWCIPTKGEIPAVNELAKKYDGKIDFVVLFWDHKSAVRKAARQYHRKVHIIYVDELKNRDAYTIKMLKHSIGFPSTFIIASDKKILELTKNHQNSLDMEHLKATDKCKAVLTDFVSLINNYETELSVDY